MARPGKQGMDYFPLDTDQDQDDKLGMIIGEFSHKGELFWIKLLSYIYRNNGYYTEWGEDAQLRFLRRYNYCGFSVSFINEVVPRLIKWGLLDETVFNSFQILTSVRIQKTWLEVSRKRKGRKYCPNYWLLGVNDGFKAEESGLITEETTQSKVNKTKVEERKGINGPLENLMNSKELEKSPPPVARQLSSDPMEREYLVPAMKGVWLEHSAGYPWDDEKDPGPLLSIARFISKQENEQVDPANEYWVKMVISGWTQIAAFVARDNFFGTYSLGQVAKHIQTIIQSKNNGGKKGKKVDKPSGIIVPGGERSYGKL